jgi:RimJ/RimL family protein N-acetyltransferase
MRTAKGAGGGRVDFRQKLFPEGFALTARLRLVPLQAADAFPLICLTNDPLVAHGYSLLKQPFTHDDAAKLVALPREGRGCFAALRIQGKCARDAGGEMIGCAGVLARDSEGEARDSKEVRDLEIGFWLGAPYHGRHYGAEAAGAMLDLARKAFPKARIVAECPRENTASWHLLGRLGFAPGAGPGLREGAELLSWRAEAPVD